MKTYYYIPSRGNGKTILTLYKLLTILKDNGRISEEEYKKCLDILFNHIEEDTNVLHPAGTKRGTKLDRT